MYGADLAYGATSCGTDLAYGATLCPYRMVLHRAASTTASKTVPLAICLRVCLRASYAMSGTDLAYGATTRAVPGMVCGTDVAYGAGKHVVCDVRARGAVWCDKRCAVLSVTVCVVLPGSIKPFAGPSFPLADAPVQCAALSSCAAKADARAFTTHYRNSGS
eukprot:2083418-Rhodomonas_salina.1